MGLRPCVVHARKSSDTPGHPLKSVHRYYAGPSDRCHGQMSIGQWIRRFGTTLEIVRGDWCFSPCCDQMLSNVLEGFVVEAADQFDLPPSHCQSKFSLVNMSRHICHDFLLKGL